MSSTVCGSIAFVLHAHLPYVGQAGDSPTLEERWLYEAVTDTYLPLIDMCDRLLADGVRFRLTLSVSPTLLAMLDDPKLIGRTRRHLAALHRLAQSETLRLWGDTAFAATAQMYESRFRRLTQLYDRLDGDLIGKLRELRGRGCLELIACAATHAFLPLAGSAAAIRAQFGAAVAEFRRHFGNAPAGVWLPECGYTPAVEPQLAALGLRYFIAAAHALPAAAALGRPALTRGGACAFLRDPASAEQVWSARTGYPGAAEYRDYYRDIGFDLGRGGGAEWDYIKPYLLPDGERLATGLKYYRVTGADAAEKAPYCPEAATRKAREHAGHFVAARREQVRQMAALAAANAPGGSVRTAPCHPAAPPVIVCPYDAELFGHWWFEGPDWLEAVLRELDQPIAQDDVVLQTTTLGEYIQLYPPAPDQIMDLPPSSWGRGGFAEVWLQPTTAWVYPLLHAAEERLALAAAAHPDPQRLPELTRRLLNQAGRELLLAQSSDWTFMLDASSFTRYAADRINRHLEHCHTLLDFAAGSPARGQSRSAAATNTQPEPAVSTGESAARPSPLDAARYVQRLEQSAPLLPLFSYTLFQPAAVPAGTLATNQTLPYASSSTTISAQQLLEPANLPTYDPAAFLKLLDATHRSTRHQHIAQTIADCSALPDAGTDSVQLSVEHHSLAPADTSNPAPYDTDTGDARHTTKHHSLAPVNTDSSAPHDTDTGSNRHMAEHHSSAPANANSSAPSDANTSSSRHTTKHHSSTPADTGNFASPGDASAFQPHQSLRILMLAWEYPPRVIGGLARAVCDLSQQLAAAGHEVHVVTCRSTDTPAYELASGVHVHRAEVLQSVQAVTFLDWVLQMNLAFADTIAELAARGLTWDVLHAHDWLVFYAARESKLRLNLPLVATIHATESGRNQGRLTGELQRRIHTLEARLTAEASRVIACSSAMQEEIARLFDVPAAKITRIPNGVTLPNPPARHASNGAGASRPFNAPDPLVAAGTLSTADPISAADPLDIPDTPGSARTHSASDSIGAHSPLNAAESLDVARPIDASSTPNSAAASNPLGVPDTPSSVSTRSTSDPSSAHGPLNASDPASAPAPLAAANANAAHPDAPSPQLAELLTAAATAGDRLLIFLGRLVHEKGVHVLLQALRLVLKRHPRARLLIAGTGPALDELRAQAAPLGSRTAFIGFADEADKRALLAAAELCVFPSLYEPFGIVALEAMASGTPLIVSDVGGLAEIVEHGVTGCKTPPGDTSALALAIAELLDEPERGRQMAQAAQQTVQERFNWATIGDSTVELYKEAAAKPL